MIAIGLSGKAACKMQENERTNDLPKSRINIFINGTDLLLYEFYSRDMMDKIICELEQKYGIELEENSRGMCG
jgi:hypothetical protein